MYYDLKYMSVPLPEDIIKLKNYGDFTGAEKMIEHLLAKEIPQALRKRLEIEQDIIRIVGINEYPFDFEEANKMMKETFSNYQEQELTDLKETGKVDWLFIDGNIHFQRRFLMNLIKTQADYEARLLVKEDSEVDRLRKQELTQNIQLMKENGGRTVKIHLKTSIQVKKEYERPGEKVRVYLPLPKSCKQASEIEILSTTPEATFIAPEEEAQRTVFFETTLEEDQVFSVEYSYINHVDYVELDPDKAIIEQPDFELSEQLPHIRFTPYLEQLLEEILAGETNPIKKARKIYDFITTKVNYSFMREYFTIDNISEYAAVNLKGDCGVQAILFITLCRMAKIPAKWQSGLYVSQYYTGCHDWAQFYVAPYGWIFADLSFGGGAKRAGDEERWNYYFGNLDIFRMPANSEIQTDFNPSKQFLRADPIDNQRGEFEYENQGLPYAYLDVKQELIKMEELVNK
ncbi:MULTISPECIES: transglutaminase-like domain-containing protein [unclassified Enterococcus]|uniref:transglutaminase-like domain-containing protein n=1 Tax=unclassified Enterococcus TaxID=2608891 RepID=UPI001CE1564B|nr:MULTISPECIES: transglutaminase domain-containing protein [unclassified Enterococcus]MCA5012533.1 transglutaminase domain-containing protein [Enterococcus sp. S23]MCA5015784.1 transglutaminase domain-containing protein [Enterococcus sp. S22(2020)]